MRAVGRSLSDFGDLLDAEKLLLKNCCRGVVTRVGAAKPSAPTLKNHIRGDFLRFLLLGGDENVAIHEQGIRISFAYISGVLDLEFSSVPHSFYAQGCFFEGLLKCSRAEFKREICLLKSSIIGFVGHGVSVAGDLNLQGIKSQGEVSLDGAAINGSLRCAGAHLEGEAGWALSAKDARVRGDVLLSANFKALSCVRFNCAKVGGQFNCSSGSFEGKNRAIIADGIHVKGGVYLRDGFNTKGGVSFIGADVQGLMTLQGANLKAGKNHALCADRICINGSLFLSEGFRAKGLIALRGARISGTLSCQGARITGRQSHSITADRMHLGGTAFLGDGFYAKGYVRLVGAKIGGDLNFLETAKIKGLLAARVTVSGSLIIKDIVSPLDRVVLSGARATALNDDAKSWGAHLMLNGFNYELLDVHSTVSVEERVKWLGKQCGQFLDKGVKQAVKKTVFIPQPWQQLKTVLENMGRVEESREIGIEFERHRAKCGQVGLTPDTWGFIRRGINSGAAKTLHYSYGKLIGYGYRPMQLVPWFLGVWLLTTMLYWYAANQGAVFAPSDPLIFQNEAYMTCQPSSDKTFEPAPGTGNWYLCDALPQEYTGFSPIAFSLDLLLPLVDLHQENDWAPLIETPKANIGEEMLGIFTLKRFVRFVMWFEILAGWVFSLLFVVIVSGLARRKEQ